MNHTTKLQGICTWMQRKEKASNAVSRTHSVRRMSSGAFDAAMRQEHMQSFGSAESRHVGHKCPGGFTIVELLVAIIVGSIVTTSAMMIIVSHTRISQRGRDLIIANAFIENKVESLRSIGFSGLGVGTTDITSELPTELSTPRSGNVEVTSESSAIKRVSVSITYNDQGASRNYSYTTFVGELGVGQY